MRFLFTTDSSFKRILVGERAYHSLVTSGMENTGTAFERVMIHGELNAAYHSFFIEDMLNREAAQTRMKTSVRALTRTVRNSYILVIQTTLISLSNSLIILVFARSPTRLGLPSLELVLMMTCSRVASNRLYLLSYPMTRTNLFLTRLISPASRTMWVPHANQ